jgi:hypothetical protein
MMQFVIYVGNNYGSKWYFSIEIKLMQNYHLVFETGQYVIGVLIVELWIIMMIMPVGIPI